MHLAIKQGRFELRLVMARRTVAASRPRRELLVVRIFMTALAAFMLNRKMEVHTPMTLGTGQRSVLLHKFELRQVVIEIPAGLILLPATGAMARIATPAELRLLKRAPMRILMATLASCKHYATETPGLLLYMAFLARNRLVHTCQRKLGLRMQEPRGRFPSLLRMALQTVCAKLAPMWLHMTTGALAAQTEKRSRQVFEFDLRPRRATKVFGGVATLAPLHLVLALQHEACL